MERIEMRDKSHRSPKKIQTKPTSEQKEERSDYDETSNKNSATESLADGYLVVMVSYLENNAQMGISHVEATIRRIDEVEFREEISKCRGSKPATFLVINKYSPINRENRSTGNISIGYLPGSSWSLGVPGPSGTSGADGVQFKDAFTW